MRNKKNKMGKEKTAIWMKRYKNGSSQTKNIKKPTIVGAGKYLLHFIFIIFRWAKK